MKYIVTYFDGESQGMAQKEFESAREALNFHAGKFINNLIPFHGPHPTIREAELIMGAPVRTDLHEPDGEE